MTRALSTRSSKRRAVSSQEVVPDDCKENSPLILSQSNSLKSTGKLYRNDKTSRTVQSSSGDMKENISPATTKLVSFRRKACGRKINLINHSQSPEKVLCDRTNSLNIKRPPKRNDSFCSLSNNSKGNKSTLQNAIASQKPNNGLCLEKETKVPHIPVYKALGSSDLMKQNHICSEKNDDVYQFECDKNEEPVKAKKRKRKATVRKKTGAKAFTINNIKYSSTESLVSLPENITFPRKNTIRRPAGKINNAKNQLNTTKLDGRLNNNIVKCSSKPNFEESSKYSYCVNNPTDKSNENNRACDLSVLMEESKVCESSVSNIAANVSVSSSTTQAPNNISTSNHSSSLTLDFRSTPSLSSKRLSQLRLSQNHVLNRDQQVFKPVGETVSKVSSNEAKSHLVGNYATVSVLDFLSSTPLSHVVQNHSVFDRTFDEIDERQRPSTSFISKFDRMHNVKDDLFGFDEPEELEEPLVSPIKHITNQVTKRQKAASWTLFADDKAKPQPSAQEVIEMLKASIPKRTKQEEIKEAFNSSEENAVTSLEEEQVETNFKKPPRRSYERQKQVHHHREEIEEEEEEENDEGAERQKPLPVPERATQICKPYKRNATKASASTRVKQKTAKAELELEKLAAQMNAQFKAVDKVSLVVE